MDRLRQAEESAEVPAHQEQKFRLFMDSVKLPLELLNYHRHQSSREQKRHKLR